MTRFLPVLLCAFVLRAGTINPEVKSLVDAVAEERITATLKRLEAFGTRHLLSSDTDPEHGIGAARRWLFAEFQSASPRLQVSFDTYRVKKQGVRIIHDVELHNVVAVLPGIRHPGRQILVTAHYDSLAIVKKPNPDKAEEGSEAEVTDWEKSADAPFAPGVTDDGSGVAVVLELARVLSRQQFDATLVFIAFSGEEEGLVGSSLHAQKAKDSHQNIEAVLNNDIVGSEVAGDGRIANRVVNIYSGDPDDSPSRAIARYVKQTAERYVPNMDVNLVFRADRFARGGDHTPFDQLGFAAVRVTSPAENFSNQHSTTDTFHNTSPSYTTMVAKINAAAAATLALAPAPPIVTREVKSGEQKGRTVPRISRGKSGYDAVLRWAPAELDADTLGYSVMIRSTGSAMWEKEIFVGNVLEVALPGVSIDDVTFGVKAIDKSGNESPVSCYVMVTRPLKKIETY